MAIKKSGVDLTRVEQLSVATMLGAKAISEGRGARTGLITTRGIRDVLEIRRAHRIADPYNLYNLQQELPKPFAPRRWRKEVTERLDSRGRVAEALNEEEVRKAARELKKEAVDSIAIVFLFSVFNPEHEELAEKIVREEFPEAFVTTSSSVASLLREYERTSTTAANAFTAPLFAKDLTKLSEGLNQLGFRGKLFFMQSNGSLYRTEAAQDKFVNTIFSEPASGAMGARYLGKALGLQNILSFNMGGAFCSSSFIYSGEPDVTYEANLAEHAISLPMLDAEIIGKGGDSIVWVDSGSTIRVGPRSAVPKLGPVCYQKGGEELTLTDVGLVLGYINPDFFLSGEMKLDKDAASRALKDMLCGPAGIDSVESAASYAFDIANAIIVGGIREKAMRRSYDLSEFTLFAFGGCGPTHALRIAPLLDVEKVIVPLNAGTFPALGPLVADIQYDYVQMLVPARDTNIEYVNESYARMEKEGRGALQQEGVPDDRILLKRAIGLRYATESHEVTLPLPRATITKEMEELEKAFHEQHELQYGHKILDEPIVVVSLYLSAIGLLDKPELSEIQASDSNPAQALKDKRNAYFPETGIVLIPVYDRALLLAGHLIEGPAIIEESYSSTVVFLGQKAQVDKYGNLVVEV